MRGALSVEGRNQFSLLALAPFTRAGTMSDECKLELCAESIWPSKICAQLAGMMILAMDTCTSSVGAQRGGTKGVMVSGGPIYAHTAPAHSWVG